MASFIKTARIGFVAFAAAASILMADAAEAATCKALKAQLASVASSKVGSSRYAKAIRRQRVQIGRVERLLRKHSCSARKSAACSTLRRSFREMERNMRLLKRRAKRADGSAVSKRRRLRKRIAARCDSASRRVTARVQRSTQRERKSASRRRIIPGASRGTYKTMCVRMCDGFSFPVSLSTTPVQFGNDANACNALCPGAGTRLYAAPANASAIEGARDVETGELYPALPTAFRFRKIFDRSCQCRMAGSRGVDYGKPIDEPRAPRREATLKPAPNVRVVGPDYFAR